MSGPRAAGMVDGTLATPFGLSAGVLREAGLLLLPFAAFVAYVATRRAAWRTGVTAVVAGNAVWVLASVLLLLERPATPLGAGFVLGLAGAVLAFAALERVALRRATATAAAA